MPSGCARRTRIPFRLVHRPTQATGKASATSVAVARMLGAQASAVYTPKPVGRTSMSWRAAGVHLVGLALLALLSTTGGAAADAMRLDIPGPIIGLGIYVLLLRSTTTIGIAMGQAAHIIGTEALTRRNAKAAAFSSLAMVLAGLATAVLLPLLWPLLF